MIVSALLLLLAATSSEAKGIGLKCSKCGPNEKDTSKEECLSACEPTCEYPVPQVCIAVCARRTCTCNTGFYRNGYKQCVAWKDCPPLPDPCADYPCIEGETCIRETHDCGNPPCPDHPLCKPSASTKPKCTGKPKPPVKPTKPIKTPKSSEKPPNPPRCPPNTCSPTDQIIFVNDDITCKGTACSQHTECLPPDIITCNNLDCQPNSVCRNIPDKCTTCPCTYTPTCIPQGGCGKNEELKSGCIACDKLCPGQEDGMECNPVCDVEECRCSVGFYRDTASGQCVSLKECPAKPGNEYKKTKVKKA